MTTSLVEMMPEEAKPSDPVWTTAVMMRELGAVAGSLIYAEHLRAQGDEKGACAREANARIDLADLITQCYVLAEQMKWPWLAMENDGRERFFERMKEISEGTL